MTNIYCIKVTENAAVVASLAVHWKLNSTNILVHVIFPVHLSLTGAHKHTITVVNSSNCNLSPRGILIGSMSPQNTYRSILRVIAPNHLGHLSWLVCSSIYCFPDTWTIRQNDFTMRWNLSDKGTTVAGRLEIYVWRLPDFCQNFIWFSFNITRIHSILLKIKSDIRQRVQMLSISHMYIKDFRWFERYQLHSNCFYWSVTPVGYFNMTWPKKYWQSSVISL